MEVESHSGTVSALSSSEDASGCFYKGDAIAVTPLIGILRSSSLCITCTDNNE